MKRNLAAVFCDILPVKESMRKSKYVRMPRESLRIIPEEQWTSCEDILKEASLDFEDIALEIVDSEASKDAL